MIVDIVRLHHNLPAKYQRLHKYEDSRVTCGFWLKLWKYGLKVEWTQSGRTKYCTDCGRRVDIDEWYYRNTEYLCPKCWIVYAEKMQFDCVK